MSKTALEKPLEQPVAKFPEMPEIIEKQKKQPFYYWHCNFPLPRGKKCKHKDKSAQRGPLELRANQHWNKHLREQSQN